MTRNSPAAKECWRRQRAEGVVKGRAVPLMHEINVEIDGHFPESNAKVYLRDTRCFLKNHRDVFRVGFSKSARGNFFGVFNIIYWFAWGKKKKKRNQSILDNQEKTNSQL